MKKSSMKFILNAVITRKTLLLEITIITELTTKLATFIVSGLPTRYNFICTIHKHKVMDLMGTNKL